MKFIRLLPILMLAVLLSSCSNSLTIPSLKELPPVPNGKARIVHIFENSPNIWKITPIYISVNGRPRHRVNLEKVVYTDVAAGQHLLSYEQKKSHGARDGVTLNFLPKQTRYLYCRARQSPNHAAPLLDRYELDLREVDALQAEALIRRLQ